MQGASVCRFTKTDGHEHLLISRTSFSILGLTFCNLRDSQNLTMGMDRKLSEGDPNNVMPPSDEELAITVITTYLLAQSKEFQQLSQLRQQVSFHFSLYSNHWYITNITGRDGRTPKATSFSPTSVPVQTLRTRAPLGKQSRARKSSSR